MHPKDGWEIPHNTVCYLQPITLEERSKIAKDFLKTMRKSPKQQFELWLDTMENKGAILFRAEPERLFIIRGKKVVFVGGKGPQDYDPWKVEKWLEKEFGY